VSDWDVHLVFSKGSSNKFWRARTEDCRMYVNYGRVGTNGQTQVKDFPSSDRARAELDKVAGQKRRKGYVDEGEPGGAAAGEAPAAVEKPPAKKGKAARLRSADLELTAQQRRVELRLEQQGSTLRTVVVEHHDSPEAARDAFDRVRAAMAEEGYREVADRETL
jgi:predicted DNA-binding WGR domain protein